MRRLALLLPALAGVLAFPAAAPAYPWPFKPFGQQHPIRGFFGDPRTVFGEDAAAGGIDGPGAFSFHQGVDVSAPDGTPIYAVANGRAHYLSENSIDVATGHRVVFQFFHVVPVIGEGQRVYARRTILGYVQAPFGHVHLTEIDRGKAVNPLRKGHLAPFRDKTKPTVEAVELSDAGGAIAPATPVCGRVQLDAAATDTPPLPVPGAFHGLPVAPARLVWWVERANGYKAVKPHTAADFRRTLPRTGDFWNVYARGTYENAPRFGQLQYARTPGRYLFKLAASFDTRRLRNGGYVVVVRASDIRGNSAVLRRTITVANRGACPRSLPAHPRVGLPPTLAPTLKTRAAAPADGAEEPPAPPVATP
jgi:hypothetical protein